ncbi:hypothetical protein [Pedobacter gandavensis]|uniref:hypothetical protein n=1 Tax=Pedobacter gandavensis TaxID=2679963 RepID=UPI00292EB2E6|nr:hypothetical protein [Pedobacter gandavensis]
MRRKKAEKLKEEQFWNDFFFFNVPAHLNEVPLHLQRVNFRYYHADDEGIERMISAVLSIYQLDLDGTDITNEGIRLLSKLDYLTELRLKECLGIDDGCVPDLYQIKGLELLHLGGTSISPNALVAAGVFKDLKQLFISYYAEDQKILEDLAILLPEKCKLIVNHKLYELDG